MKRLRLLLTGFTCIMLLGPVYAAEDNSPSLDLAREDQNPLTRFYTVRFEDNGQFGFGPDKELLNFFRIQPLIPFHLSENWHLVARAIIPIVHQPWPESTNGSHNDPY